MNDLQTDSEVSMTRLASGIVTDAQKLFAQQWALLRLELKDDLHKTKEAGLSLVSGSVIALVGAILLSFMLVELLSWAAPELPSWVRYGIMGVPITALGSALVFAGIQKFRSIQLLPDQSVQALKETFQWRTNPK